MVKRIFSLWGMAVLCASAAVSQDESFRFFFDPAGVGEEEPRPAGNLAFTNPTVDGSGRLYLYVEYGTNNQEFHGINLVIEILSGPAIITSGHVYDHDIPAAGVDRWQVLPNPNWGGIPDDTPTRWVLGSIFKVGEAAYGAKNVNSNAQGHPSSVDSHFSGYAGGDGSTFGTTLLGYVDVESIPGAMMGEVYIHNGTSGNGGVTFTPSDWVYFGFGDGPFPNKKGGGWPPYGYPRVLPDAFVIPEPVTAALSILGVMLFSRVRKHRRNP